MGKFVAKKTVKMILKVRVKLINSKVGIFGLTFKENCPYLRNSRVMDIIEELQNYGIETIVNDPVVKQIEAPKHLKITLPPTSEFKNLAALIIPVPHNEYKKQNLTYFTKTLTQGGCLIDVKSMLGIDSIKNPDINFCRL